MDVRTLQVVREPSEENCWKIVDQEDIVPIGFVYLIEGKIVVDWIYFGDGYAWPEAESITDAIYALQKYFEDRWLSGTLVKKVYIN